VSAFPSQVFSYFGTATPEAAALLLYLIPVLWISKLRQLRLIFKVIEKSLYSCLSKAFILNSFSRQIALNLALPVIYNFDFLMPILPAPLQVKLPRLSIIHSGAFLEFLVHFFTD